MGASRLISDGNTHFLSWATLLAGDTAFTLMFWAKRTGTLNLDALFNLRHGGSAGEGICNGYWWTGGNGMIVQMHHATDSGSTTYATELSALIDSTLWHHYAIAWDGAANRAKIYIDGVDLSAAGSAGLDAVAVANDLQIG